MEMFYFERTFSKELCAEDGTSITSHAFPLKIPWERSACVLAAGAEGNRHKDKGSSVPRL